VSERLSTESINLRVHFCFGLALVVSEYSYIEATLAFYPALMGVPGWRRECLRKTFAVRFENALSDKVSAIVAVFCRFFEPLEAFLNI